MSWFFDCLDCDGTYTFRSYPDFNWSCPNCGSDHVLVETVPDEPWPGEDQEMKFRARHIDKIEVAVDTVIGTITNYIVTYYAINTFTPISWEQNAYVTVVCMTIRTIEKYGIRRTFSNIIKKVYSDVKK